MTTDRLFGFIERLQGSTEWWRFLDAGTGRHSLQWVSGLKTRSWTAVTGDPLRAQSLTRKFSRVMRPTDQFVAGNWQDAAFLHGERYDVVLADYLLGAIDGFAPYFQDRLFPRLRPHVGARFYIVGLQPYELLERSPAGLLIRELARLRDACILLAGDRCYREYPLEWVTRHVEEAGFVVEEAQTFPIRYGAQFFVEQLNVCERKLTKIQRPALVKGLRDTIADLRERGLALCRLEGDLRFGEDYVVCARPRQ